MKLTHYAPPRVNFGVSRYIWLLATVFASALPAFAQDAAPAASPAPQSAAAANNTEKKLTPEEAMERRFPQPVAVGFLAGLPLLDEQDSTIGYIQKVVRTPDGKIKLIVAYNPWFGWLRSGSFFDRWRRAVAVPIEAVAILARQVDALDMSRPDFDAAPTFEEASAAPLPADEQIRIAVARR